MKGNRKGFFSAVLAAALVVSSLSPGMGGLTANAEGSNGAAEIELTQEQVDALVNEMNGVNKTHTSVHDPSIVVDNDTYYLFGSHMAVSKSTDLQNWSLVVSERDPASSLYGVLSGGETVDKVTYTKDQVVLSSDTDITKETNPFYGKDISDITMEFTINLAEAAAGNGWDGLFSFYNSNTTGRVSVQVAPYICYNEMLAENNKYMDINNPNDINDTAITGGYNAAVGFTKGTDYRVKLSINSNGAVAVVNDQEISISATGSGATYDDLLDFISTCDQLTWGVGNRETAFWDNEICTLSNMSFSATLTTPEVTVAGEVVPASYNDAFTTNAYTGTVATTSGDQSFGSYDVVSWIADNPVVDNMWAPDVIYNPTMGKWCMYYSLNGKEFNSAVVLLTADDIEGPYVYQGPVVFTGFSDTKSYTDTDMELVLGTQTSLPERYNKMASSTWGTYWPHAIDPCVFYDDDGNLWMTYGSWFGGIYTLQLDETTGLRDYTVSYDLNYTDASKEETVTSDPYFGKKIAGGCGVSGEGSYIQKIGNYYYLFLSYGFYDPNGGYNMRIFRSESPDGAYVDAGGNSAIYEENVFNYHATMNRYNRGEKLLGNYKWSTMERAEIAQGHNSAFVDSDGKAYLIYHTKFEEGWGDHQVRVHQLFVNEDGWLVAAPYEYSGETQSASGYETSDVVGSYELLVHDYAIDYANLAYKTPENITLNEDGTITGDYEGTWTTDGTNIQLSINSISYLSGTAVFKGVLTGQVIDESGVQHMCFTAANTDGKSPGLNIWGSGEAFADAAVAQNAVDNTVVIPENTYADLELPSEGLNGAVLTWTSSNPAVLSNDGVITVPKEDTEVTLTERISKGNYYFEKEYTVTVKADIQNGADYLEIGSCFTEEAADLSTGLDQHLSMANPFHKNINYGLDLSNGATIEFDVASTGDLHVLGTIFSFMANEGADGRLYFTPGSYLGYNGPAGIFDANMKNYGLVTDYIGESAHVAIRMTTTGFTVSINGEVAYTEEICATENGTSTVSNYADVLDWLQNTADTLYFGYGSFWNTAGYDEANITLSNVTFSVGEENPEEETPGEETPGEETPGEETPGEETPGEETPGEETPGEETPGEETPGEETPGEEMPGEETPGEETPGNNEAPGNSGETSNQITAAIGELPQIVGSVTEGTVIIVQTEAADAAVLKAEVLEAIAGKDITLVITLENGVKWTVNGENLNAESYNDIPLSVILDITTISTEVINGVTDASYYRTLELIYSGSFGGTIQIAIPLNTSISGQYANLFYYNEATGKLEYVHSAQVDAAGMAEFNFTHASKYVIYISEKAMNQDSVITASQSGSGSAADSGSNAADGVVQTGDHTMLMGYIILMAAAALSVLLYRKKAEMIGK